MQSSHPMISQVQLTNDTSLADTLHNHRVRAFWPNSAGGKVNSKKIQRNIAREVVLT